MLKCAAQKYLEQVKDIKISINAKKAQIEELRERAEGIRSALNSDSGGGSSAGNAAFTNAINKIVDLQFKIASETYRLATIIEEISNKITLLSNEDSKAALVLELRYINCLSWKQINALMRYYDERSIFRIHRAALFELKKHI